MVTLLPSILLIAVLVTYLVISRFQDMEQQFNLRGKVIAEQLAAASITSIVANNHDALRLLSKDALRVNQELLGLRILDPHGLVLFAAGNPTPSATKINNRFEARIQTSNRIQDIYRYSLDHPLLLTKDNKADLGNIVVWIDPRPLLQKKQQIITTAVTISILGLLLSVFLALFLSQRISRPLEQLTQATRNLSRGHLQTRVDIGSSGEIAELQTAFNTMAEELHKANEHLHARIEQATQELQQSMEVLEIQNVELDLARKKALRATQVKSEFVANMSHEIRTPMNGVLGFVHMLRKTPLNQTQTEYLETIESSAHNLLTIINDILDLSKLEAGRFELDSKPFSLRQSFNNTISLLAPLAHGKHLDLTLMIYSDVPDALVGDEIRIAQIITNLVNNAIKFTATGEITVRVMLEHEDDTQAVIHVSVQDTGCGISPQDQKQIFSAFAQGRQIDAAPGGTGLGLSICKQLLNAMQGDISVSSSLGKGSRFEFAIPLKKAAEPIQTGITGTLAQHRICLFDDLNSSATALKHQLMELGLQVALAGDWRKTEPAIVEKCDADLIVLSLSAKQMKNDATKAIRTLLGHCRKPALLLASSSDQSALKSLCAGFNCQYLSKPTKPAILQHLLSQMLLPDAAGHESPHHSRNTPVSSVLKNRLILVADDNAINRRLMRLILEAHHCRVLLAENGQEAVDQVFQHAPDLVLMDIQMPILNGTDAMLAIRAHAQHQATRIVALTADIMRKNRLPLGTRGFDACIIKPIAEDKLIQTLQQLLLADRTYQTSLETTDEQDISQHDAKPLPIRDMAQALRIAGGSESIADSLFLQLLQALPQDLQHINERIDQQQWEEAWQAIHKLQGSSALCGLSALSQRLKQLQAIIQHGQVEQILGIWQQVEKESRRLQAHQHQAD